MTAPTNFGKHYASMYQGSMVGAGAVAFALMGYIISSQVPVGEAGQERMEVELNPKLLAFIFGESEAAVEGAIKFLEGPDDRSRTKAEEGRRIVRVGQFAYWVVNGMAYRAYGSSERRREQNRAAQARFRQKQKGAPSGREQRFVKAVEAGDEGEADRIAAEGLPSGSAAATSNGSAEVEEFRRKMAAALQQVSTSVLEQTGVPAADAVAAAGLPAETFPEV